MKGLPPYLNTMYTWAFAVLLLCAAASAYVIGTFPTGLVAAILICSVLDIVIKRFILKRSLSFPASFPSSAAITGIIIGSIAPIDAPLRVIFAASIAAIASKYIIEFRGRHIFNPATLGLVAALSFFRLGDVWWAASGFNVIGLPLTILLILPNLKAGKLRTSIPFLFAISALYIMGGFASSPSTGAAILAFIAGLPFYFAFIMLSEPKTSPYAAKEQVIFGVAVAILVFALESSHAKFPYLLGLLIGNLGFAVYRNLAVKKSG